MSGMRRSIAAATLALLACGAHAQVVGNGKFKEGMKPGLYDTTATTEMRGMGVPKGEEVSTEKKQRCVTQKELDQGIELRKDCTITKNEESASGLHVMSTCKDGSVNEFRMAKHAGGYNSEIKSQGKSPEGKPFSMSMKVDAKYLGTCKG